MTPERASRPRLLLSETLDPDGALHRWLSPDVRTLGWDVRVLPTQEAVHLLGSHAYAELVLDVVAELRPHVLLCHPPYDHLPPGICTRIREQGARLVAMTFDDALFVDSWGAIEHEDLLDRFDLWCTTDLRGPGVQAGAVPLRWALSTASLPTPDPAAPCHDVLLTGRRRPERARLVAELASRGIEVATYGAGWPNGSVTASMHAGLLRRAGVVITPNDSVDMIKVRLLEAGLAGAAQVVEWATDLDAYFPGGNAPPSWRTAEECAALIRSGAEPADFSAHTWIARWPEVTARLTLAALPEGPRSSRTLDRLCCAVGHGFEQRGHVARARPCFEAAEGPVALAGQARCALARSDWATALERADAAIDLLEVAPATAYLQAFVPSHGQGTGMGLVGGIDPRIELEAIGLVALLETGRVDEATRRARRATSKARTAIAQVMCPDEQPERAAFWEALSASPAA